MQHTVYCSYDQLMMMWKSSSNLLVWSRCLVKGQHAVLDLTCLLIHDVSNIYCSLVGCSFKIIDRNIINASSMCSP